MNHHAGVSRREVIVLLAILTVSVALIVSAIESSREASRRHSCRNNLRQYGLSLRDYHIDNNSFPYGSIGNLDFPPDSRWSCYPALMPRFEQAVRVPIDYMTSSKDRTNIPITFEGPAKGGGRRSYKMNFDHLVCPNGNKDRDHVDQVLMSYIGMAGVGKDGPLLAAEHPRAGIWAYDFQRSMNDVKKNKDSTIFVIESAKERGSWYRGGSATVRPFIADGTPIIGKNAQFGGFHPGAAMTLFVDGHVKPLSTDIDPDVFRRMATIADDER